MIDSPGLLIKAELKDRGISQKLFASALGVGQSYLCDILAGRRRISMQFARKVESLLDIPLRKLMDLQVVSTLVSESRDAEVNRELEYYEKINEIDKLVNVKSLLNACKCKKNSAAEKIKILKTIFGIYDKPQLDLKNISKGCFRKSTVTGLDHRMILTWVVIAYTVSKSHVPVGKFDRCHLLNLCEDVSRLFHRNCDTISQLKTLLSNAGIGFVRIDKLDRASVDGFSFYRDEIPYIAVTCRYDRIDNLAFTVLHELGHLFYGHTNQEVSCINIDIRSFDDEISDEREKEADEFAGDMLIKPEIWKSAPTVSANAWAIQHTYSKWAKSKGLNEWIVLGRLSHETGMYKFKSDETRRIGGGKGVCHEII